MESSVCVGDSESQGVYAQQGRAYISDIEEGLVLQQGEISRDIEKPEAPVYFIMSILDFNQRFLKYGNIEKSLLKTVKNYN